MLRSRRLDGPFWAVLLAGALGVGTLAFFGLAAAVQDRPIPDAAIMTTDHCPPPRDLR